MGRKSTQPKDKNIYVGDPDLHGVERIVNRRARKRKIEYLLQWKGYSEADNTWEKEANVSQDLIIAFENERRSISARKAKQRKIELEVPSVESNGTFEVPAASTSKDTSEKLHVEEKIQSTENLCHNDRLKALTQVPSEMLMDTSEDTSEFEKLELEAPPTQVLMEVSEYKQNEWLNRIPSKEPGYVKIHSLRKKSSRSKILVQEFSTTPAQVLKTSTKKSSTITYEMSPERPGSVNMRELPRLRNSKYKVPTVATKVLNTSTSKTSTITLVDICMQSAYISEDENERDLLGYDGFQPVYA